MPPLSPQNCTVNQLVPPIPIVLRTELPIDVAEMLLLVTTAFDPATEPAPMPTTAPVTEELMLAEFT